MTYECLACLDEDLEYALMWEVITSIPLNELIRQPKGSQADKATRTMGKATNRHKRSIDCSHHLCWSLVPSTSQ